ncbi:MAG: TetR/AcrR family transcriptional regulator [Gammaproteobacteria bacterium]|nr:TetR/AcrR family transcriptional regulator [Gammaproteobacteria bacterium]
MNADLPDDAGDSRAARSAVTRAKLVAIAERLFAERGIEGVSLNDINKAAGQRNKNATHYHFGSKQGLLQAILDKHEPGIAARRDHLLDECEARGELTLRNIVHAMVQALAEKLFDPDGGRDFIRFNAQLVITHTTAALRPEEATLKLSEVERVTTLLRRVLPNLPDELAYQRGILSASLLMHGMAEYSRVLDGLQEQEARAHAALLVADLEDGMTALLAAEPSPETRALLATIPRTPAAR